jgi:glycosyltransferase involved in cell wall biosynthesis
VHRAANETKCDVLHIQYQTGAFAMHPVINLLPLRFKLHWTRPKIVTTFHDLRVPYLFPKAGPVRLLANRLLLENSDAAILTNVEDFLSAARRQIRVGCHGTVACVGHTRVQDLASKQLEGCIPGRRDIPSYSVDSDQGAWSDTSHRNSVGRYHLVPIGSNIAVSPTAGFQREAWRARLGLSEGETLLCYFGLLNASKGLDVLLVALHKLRSAGRSLKLLIVGGSVGDTDPTNLAFRDQIERLIDRLALQDHLIWTGHLASGDVSAALLAADICVLPFHDGASFRRGSLMAVLAHGRPLITTRARTRDEHAVWEKRLGQPVLVDGEHCLLIPPDDAAALAEAIAKLAEDRARAERLGRGAAMLAEHFTWQSIARRNLEIYQEILR